VVLPPRADAVLLDLDGTLSEAGPAITAAVEVALAHVGLDPLDPVALRAFVGPPLEDSFVALGLSHALVQDAVRVYREHYDLLSSPLYDGVPDLLRALRAAGLPLALATSKPQALAQLIVDGTPLSGLLDVVVGSEDDGRSTKGDVVAEALRRLGGPGAPVMVGDRRYDVQGASEHGVPCIGVLWGYGDEDELRGAGAAALARAPADLRPLLLGRS
jgi:phosphoglycolate phosphatase